MEAGNNLSTILMHQAYPRHFSVFARHR
jgi:hypothetical protein